jgi:RNA polymerase sigma factor (sigma-70 family)
MPSHHGVQVLMITELEQTEAIAAGDADAFASWMAAAELRLRGSLRPFARDVDTESVLQECLLRVWQVAPRFKPDGKPEGLLRFAMRTARNLAIDEVRKQGRGVGLPPELDPGPGPHIERAWLRTLLLGCLERLPERARLALEMRLRSSGARDEVLAEAVGMTLNTFFQNIRRARLALLGCLKQHGYNPEKSS